MDNRNFFRVLWRINAVLIFCAAIWLIGKSVYDEFYRPYRYSGSTANAITVLRDEQGKVLTEEKWQYGVPEQVKGTTTVLVPLHLLRESKDGSSSRYSMRNILFTDAALSVGQWLFADNQHEILDRRVLEHADNGQALAILYIVTNAASATEEPVQDTKNSIYLSRPDGSDLKQVMEGMNRRLSEVVIDEDQVVIYYIQNGQVHSAKIDLANFEAIEDTTLPSIIE
jgi:hypothetical protein